MNDINILIVEDEQSLAEILKKQLKESGFNVGADDYVIKPFDFRELLARVNVFLISSKSNDQTAKHGLKISQNYRKYFSGVSSLAPGCLSCFHIYSPGMQFNQFPE